MAMVAAAAIMTGAAVGGNLLGASMQSRAAKNAAYQQGVASDNALNMQERHYQQERADMQPWREAGVKALGGMQDADFQRDFTMNDFQKDPGYQFRMDEANKALERSAAARGGLNSGATLKALTKYNSDYASNEYGKAYDRFNNDRTTRFNRLASLSGAGQTATQSLNNASENYANQGANLLTGIGNSNAAATVASGNAWGNAIANSGQAGMNTWMQMQMMNKPKKMTTGSSYDIDYMNDPTK